MLSVGGIALLGYTPWIALAVGVLMLVVVASYRQNVHAYPSGGGDYEVSTTNLGQRVGLVVASALMVDYTLTVAVSVSAAWRTSPRRSRALNAHVTIIAVLVVATIALMNLRGVRESGTVFAIPTYCFIGGSSLMIIWGFIRLGWATRCGPRARATRCTRPAHYSRARAGVPAAARVLLRLHGADRCRGDQQRGAGVPQAEEQERRDHAGPARHHRGLDVRRWSPRWRWSATCTSALAPADLRAARRRPAHRDRPGRARRCSATPRRCSTCCSWSRR